MYYDGPPFPRYEVWTMMSFLKYIIWELSTPIGNEARKEADEWTWYGLYHLGYLEPHYPLPVIITEVIIEQDYIEICELITPREVYPLMMWETVYYLKK